MPGLTGRLDSPIDSSGSLISVFPRPNTYRMVYRAANRPYARTVTVGAGTRNIVADFQHVFPALKSVTIRHVWLSLQSSSAASVVTFDFIHQTQSSNLGGVNITPFSSAGNITSECKGNLSTSNLLNQDFVFSTMEFNTGITGAAPTGNPPQDLLWQDLLERNYATDIGRLPFSPSGTDSTKRIGSVAGANDSWGIAIDSSASSTIVFLGPIIEFTEE